MLFAIVRVRFLATHSKCVSVAHTPKRKKSFQNTRKFEIEINPYNKMVLLKLDDFCSVKKANLQSFLF